MSFLKTKEAKDLLDLFIRKVGEPKAGRIELERATKAIQELGADSELLALAEALQYLGRYTWNEVLKEYEEDVKRMEAAGYPVTGEGLKRLGEVFDKVCSSVCQLHEDKDPLCILNEEETDCGSCGADLGPSNDFPWHYPDADCRSIKDPIGGTK